MPVFLPDGTRGVVKSLDTVDLQNAGISCFMINTLHLSIHPGISLIKEQNGIHDYINWQLPLASDSGGFQIFSIIEQNKNNGSVSKDGFIYRADLSKDKKKLTPESCIQKQFKLGTDIMFCLDYCTHPDADESRQRESIELTINWAKRCKKEFNSLVQQKKLSTPPLLFGIVQGGNNKQLRKECTERLLEIGFDGFGYGGWPVDKEGRLLDMVTYQAELLQDKYPLHGLGIGMPENLVAAYLAGYRMFDCVLPTRDARKKRIYIFKDYQNLILSNKKDFYEFLYLQDQKHWRDKKPLEENCDCFTCQNYSKAYIAHLFNINEPLAMRLATIHNLRFYTRLVEKLKFVK